MDTAVCGLALYEHSEVGREWYDLISNYLVGISSGHGFDEAWNEGPGYGSSKSKWLVNASLYFDTTIPHADLGKNPFYDRMGEYFCRVIPVGDMGIADAVSTLERLREAHGARFEPAPLLKRLASESRTFYAP